MASDQDPTPRYHRRHQSSADRDLAARRARTSYPHGVPVLSSPRPEEDADVSNVTSPYDLLEREPDHEVQEIIEKATRNASDPATFSDAVKLAVALTKKREHDLRVPREATRSSRRHLILAAIAAATSLASAIDSRISRPSGHHAEPQIDRAEQQIDLRDQLQHQIDRLDTELRELRAELGRRSELDLPLPAGAAPALFTASKGTASKGTSP